MISISPLTSSLRSTLPFKTLNGGGHFKIGKLCVEKWCIAPHCVFSIGIPKVAPSQRVFLETLKSEALSKHLKLCCAGGGDHNFHSETVSLYSISNTGVWFTPDFC